MKKNLLLIVIAIFLASNNLVYAIGSSFDFENGQKAFLRKNYPLAIQYFRKALSTTPGNYTYRYHLANTLLVTKQFQQAQIEFQRIIQNAPYSQEAKYAKIGLVKIKDYIDNTLNPKWRSANSNMDVGVTETKSKANVGENYIDKVTEKGNVFRWQSDSMPLKVYIDKNTKKLEYFNNAFLESAKAAFAEWSKSSNNKISFDYSSSIEQANIKVFWQDVFNNKLKGSKEGTFYAAGITSPEYKDKDLYAMTITMSTTDPNGKPHTPEAIRKILMHEIGHALGIMGHSEDKNDIMYAYSQSGSGKLTHRDINTINLLYDLDPDVSNFKEKKVGKVDKTTQILGTKSERLKREIDSIKGEMKTNPKSDINHINLGNLYGNQKKYDLAIKEYKTAIKINPKNDAAYANLGSLYLSMDKPYDAINLFKEARRLKPNNPRIYLNIAITAEKLNQKSESITNLQKYLDLNPKGKDNNDVQQLMKLLGLKLN